MEKVLKILEEIKNASGKAKQDILEKNKDNDLLKKVLFFVYNPYIVTGLSDKKINKHIDDNMIRNDEDILKIFDYLKDNHTGTDKDIYYIQSFIYSQPVEYQDIYKEIFTKNLKIGITSTTINKVWKDLIPEYEVQQGYPLHKRIDKILDEDIILTQKFDGCFIKNTKITMADGSMKNIQDVKIGDTVLSYNEQSRKVEPQKVINVFNNGIKPASDWNRVHSSRFRQGYFSNICTTNHKFYTDKSWVRSENLDPREDIIFTVEKYPTNSQIGMLLGACLGDGSIMRDSYNSKNLRGRYSKKKADIDIIKKFQSCIKNLPQRTKIKERISGYGTEMVDLTFSGIVTLPNYFYNNSNWLRAGLTFTREVCNNLTPLALAIYYIDDESRIAGQNDGANVPNVRPRVCLSTYKHSKENIQNLIDTLKEKFNIIATIRQERPYKNETNTGLVVDIGADNTEKFFDLIASYVPKSIRSRKLGMNVKWQDAPEIKWWEDNNSMLKLYPLKVDSVEFDFCKKHKTGYEAFDLEIENNHNYFANGILVHNCRMTARVEDGNVQLFSRQGQIYEGLVELEQELSTLPDGCYDGELIKDMDDGRGNNKNSLPQFLNIPNYKVPEKSIINLLYAPMPSKDLFKQTTSIVNSDEKEKKGIDFFIYDMFPIENFDKMETYNETAETRKKKISLLLSTTMGTTPHLKEAPILYSGKFDSILIDAMLKQVLLCQQEGLMINLKNSPYEFKRSNNLIKVKQMYPADLKIIGFEEGTGKNKGTLGALIVNYKGFPVKVGSGFTDAERIYAWKHKVDLIGTIVTVQYFEETTNKKDNSLSLRFPVFKRISSETRRKKVITDFIKSKEKNIMNRYFLTGDTHGNFRRIMNFCQIRNTTENDVLIILGDAGINYYLDDRDRALKEVLSHLPITLLCVHGNHEERPFNIPTYKEKEWNGGVVYFEDDFPNLLFAKDGEIYNFNGKSVLVIGGAYSVDKEYRLARGYAWFKDEQPNKKIIKYVEKQINKQKHFDIVLTHTCPIKTEPRHMFLPFIDQSKVDKTTEILLQRIADWITFNDWYFGHFHGHWDNEKYHMLFEDYVEIK